MLRLKPKGFPIATTASPTCTESEFPRRNGWSARDWASTLRTATSVAGSAPTTRALDHVVVRDDVPGLVEDEAGSERALLLGKEGRAEEGLTGNGHDPGCYLHDSRSGLFVDLPDRERF